ncbi:hypothetical protein CDD83_3507 [Cordyceps sp. RAO-2017]|nr:hypothetical protein CDD83_3507 [Cordyceps sp. RAO-2017]
MYGDAGGNYRRWLEDEFRDDVHYGGITTTSDLHKRWFGRDIIDWLTRMLSPSISREFGYKIKDDFTLKILDDRFYRDLAQPLDITGSYLIFYNKGRISATMRLEALASVRYESKKTIMTVLFPGAAFNVPGIATIGPALRLDGKVDVGLTVSAEFETNIDIASWEIR